MPLGGLIVGGLTAVGSGVEGAIESGANRSAANDAAQKALQAYLKVNIPDPKEQELILQRFQQTGEMDPRLAKAFQQVQSEMSSITTNPEAEDAQLKALASLQEIADHGGHTLSEDSYLNKVQNQVATKNSGREKAIEAEFARKGMGAPSGLLLSAREQNNQNMTGIENEAAMDAAGKAQQNALLALQQGGKLAGDIRNQDFNQAATVAKAKDDINNFNTRMAQSAENQNVDTQNKATLYNLQQKQKTADQNVTTSNYEQEYNKNLKQKQFDNEMSKASGEANANSGVANQFNKNADQTGTMWSNIGQGALKAGVGIGNAFGDNSDDEEEF